MAFPLKKSIPLAEETSGELIIDYQYRLQNHEGDLLYYPERCVECGICILGCPKRAIKITDLVDKFVDQEKCVQCGICVYLCPVDALKLKINGEDRIILTETGMLPPLRGKTIQTTGGADLRKYMDGNLSVSVTGAVPEETLREFCAACPTGALAVSEDGTGVAVDEAKCFYCLRCQVMASRVRPQLPEGTSLTVKLARTRILKDATEWKVSSVWNRVTERILGPEGLSKELQGSIQIKLRDAALKLAK